MKHNYVTTTIAAIEQETPKVKNIMLAMDVEAKPGQYVMVWMPGVHEKPFGVVTTKPFMISVANVGPFTQQIHDLKVGDPLTFRGPYGSSFAPKGKKHLLVGGGYGVVPLYFLACELLKDKSNSVHVLVGSRTKEDLPFVQKFKDLGCTVTLSTDDGSAGFKGYAPDAAREIIEKETFDAVYTVGPLIMMKKVAELAREKKLYCQVSAEGHFKCGGIGLCGACSYKGKLTCVDGPIFDSTILLD